MRKVEVIYDDLGFARGFRCPYCSSDLSEENSHRDDLGTLFFTCPKCGEHSILAKTEERKRLEEACKEVSERIEIVREGKHITILHEDGRRVPLGQIYFRQGESIIIGEVLICHALIKDLDNPKREPRETVIPLIVYSIIDKGVIVEKGIEPYPIVKRLMLNNIPIFIDSKTRMDKAIDTLMSLKTARDFINGEAKKIDWKEAYNLILENIKRFVNLDFDPRLYDVCVCWCLATYFQDVLSVLPFLYPYGPSGTGKTRLLKTIIYMSRHGFVVTSPTDASIFRLSEALKPSLGIDESLLGKEAWKLIRTAFKKGSYVPRVEKTSSEEFILGLYETFMPVAFASTELPRSLGGLDADEARIIPIFMRSMNDPIGRDPEPQDFINVRDSLYLLRLSRAYDVAQSYNEVAKSLPFYGHEREIWLPLVSIAKLVGENVYNNVLSYAEELHGIKMVHQNVEERTVLRAILLMFRDTYAEKWKIDRNIHLDSLTFKSAELLPYVKRVLDEWGELIVDKETEREFLRSWNSKVVGKILHRLGIFKKMKKGINYYVISVEKFRELYLQFFRDVRVFLSGGSGVCGGLKKERVGGSREVERSLNLASFVSEGSGGGERSLNLASFVPGGADEIHHSKGAHTPHTPPRAVWLCEECGAESNVKVNVEREGYCEACGRFTSIGRAIINVKAPEVLECPVCKAVFLTEKDLEAHKRVH